MAHAAAQGAYGEVYRGFVVGRLPGRLHPGEYSASMGNRITTLLERTPTQLTTDCRINLRQTHLSNLPGRRRLVAPFERPDDLDRCWQTDPADLLVIPCDTRPAIADWLLAIAAQAGSTLTAQQMIERATPMKASARVTATDTVAAEGCYTCSHPDAAHDDIARRYCRATMTNALWRKCICSQSSTL